MKIEFCLLENDRWVLLFVVERSAYEFMFLFKLDLDMFSICGE